MATAHQGSFIFQVRARIMGKETNDAGAKTRRGAGVFDFSNTHVGQQQGDRLVGRRRDRRKR